MRCLGVVALLAGAGETRCAEPQPPPSTARPAPRTAPETSPSPEAVALATVAGSPDAWVGKEATLTGTLENQGANYFTDLRVVLKDDRGRTLAVKPWLPTALPPGPGGGPRPKTLSQYLGKKVELQATVRHGELRAAPALYYLEVRSARTVD